MKQIEWRLVLPAITLGFILSALPIGILTYERGDVITIDTPEVVESLEVPTQTPQPVVEVRAFLESKNSPLAPYTETLLEQEHWKLIIAISAIESSYCKRQLGNNCWGITDTNGSYKSYESIGDAIIDANGLITRWQARGRWLTVEDMNCHYVVPCNDNWVRVVNSVLEQLSSYE